MDYQKAKEIRGTSFGSTMTDKLLEGQGIGQSFKSAISDKTKATAVGLKEKFHPLNIAKKLTGGSRLAPALLGKILGSSQEDIEYFTDGAKKSKIGSATGIDSDTAMQAEEILGLIYRQLLISREDEIFQKEKEKEFEETEISRRIEMEEALIRALTGKKSKKETKKETTETKTKTKKPQPKKKTKKEKKTDKVSKEKTVTKAPREKTNVPSTTTPASKEVKGTLPTATKVAGAAIIAGGGILSAAALATVKGEQNVKSDKDALMPNNSPQRVKKGEFLDTSIPKVGAATPDVKGSTSYGLFGINNIRTKDKQTGQTIPGTSSIDSFVKMWPKFGLPDPGDSTNPNQVNEFNKAWWDLAKNSPNEMLQAQATWFRKNFEEPAVTNLAGKVPPNVANDPGVQLYMIDRRAQYGESMLNSALNYSKSATTPQEFINLMSEHDKTNLRQIFKSTSDNEFIKLEKGLINRINFREQEAINYSKFTNEKTTAIPNAVEQNTGAKLDESSKQNTDMKNTAAIKSQKNVNTTVVDVSETKDTNQPAQNEKVDDRSPREKKLRK